MSKTPEIDPHDEPADSGDDGQEQAVPEPGMEDGGSDIHAEANPASTGSAVIAPAEGQADHGEDTPDELPGDSEATSDTQPDAQDLDPDASDAELDVHEAPPVSKAADAALPEHRELSHEESDFFRGLIEAVLFLSTEPISLSVLASRCQLDRVNTRILVDSLVDDYAERDGGILLREIAGGYQFISSDRYSDRMKELFKEQKRETLSRSTLETLAIITYRQPITLPEIEEIRGVNSRAMVTSLLQRKLVKPQGYRPVPGRPTLYVTTRNFLSHFALSSLADLPPLEEIKELKFDELD